MVRIPKVKSMKQRCDELWKQAILKRADNKCERCGSTNIVQAHHIIPRTKYRLRFDLANGVALCYRHHIAGPDAAHKDALGFAEWISTRRNVKYLKQVKDVQTKNDYNLIFMYLLKYVEEK